MAGRRTLTELDQTTGPRDSAALIGAAPQAFTFGKRCREHRMPNQPRKISTANLTTRTDVRTAGLVPSHLLPWDADGQRGNGRAPGQRRHGWRSRSTATAQAGIPAHDSGRVSKIKGFHFVAPRLHLPLRRTVERRCSGVVLRHGWQRGRRRWRAIPKGWQGGRLALIPGAIGAWVRLEAPQRPARRRQLAAQVAAAKFRRA